MERAVPEEAAAIRAAVSEKYGRAARIVLEAAPGAGGCCGGASCAPDPISGGLYTGDQEAAVPEDALRASLGCGNPTALAELREGETVLDLGSGGGIDVLLSARRVGPEGFAYGLDMTDEMLALAERNRAAAGVENVRFLKGHIEAIPLPGASVDVVVSNCVINLSADKAAVLREAYRVLRPGGRFAVSDIVVEGELPAAIRKDLEAYVGCIAGALEVDEYVRLLRAAGFTDVTVQPTRIYTRDDYVSSGCCSPAGAEALEEDDGGARVMSAFVRAIKPAA